MIAINLLPWREEQNKVENRRFGGVVGVIIFSCLCFGFIANIYLQGLIQHEIKEAAVLSREINLLESKIKQIKGLQEQQNLLLSKRKIIQALQASRSFIVQVFADIAGAVPDGLFLLAMNRKGNKLILEGISNSNSRIAVFMRNLEQLKWLENTTLQEIKTLEVAANAARNGNTKKSKQIVFKLQGDING